MAEMKVLFKISSILFLISGSSGVRKKQKYIDHKSDFLELRSSFPPVDTKRISTTTNKSTDTDTGKEVFLRITTHMKDQNATSGGSAQFKCKVDGMPKNSIEYTWYHEDSVIKPKNKPSVSIATRSWGSRLRISNLYTLDSGLYRCEASNGLRRVHTSAILTVSFELPPPLSNDEISKIEFPEGKCEHYNGLACRKFLKETSIYVDSYQKQETMENEITLALRQLSDTQLVTDQCRMFAVPAFCYYVFPPCYVLASGQAGRGGKLCREDCELLKRDICHKAFTQRKENPFLNDLYSIVNCSTLPSAENSQCTKVGLPSSSINDEECYHGDGEEYRGEIDVSASGLPCRPWPEYLTKKYSELNGRHNFCRNPENVMDRPWCFVNHEYTRKEACNLQRCESRNQFNFLFIAIPCACIFLLLVTIGVIYFVRLRNKKERHLGTALQTTPEILRVQMPLLTSKNSPKPSIPQIKSSSIQILNEIGNGEYGKVYKGIIIDDPRFLSKEPFAVKLLKNSNVTSDLEQFQNEVKVLSNLHHPHIACLKAVALELNFHCMAFEYTDQVDLHEYLVLNSPNSDVTKHVTPNGQDTTSIDNDSFIKMAMQITSGMEYLSNSNYIHRDLAARNVLVCGKMDLKICNLGVVRDSYLSSYYRTPQGLLWPVRWMAPESIQSWEFSDKSAVWSFGVLLWEMFSYGLQPYCGYSNHEVLDMISGRQLLACPDQCPAKMYSLMHECWTPQCHARPRFQNLHLKLQSFTKEGSEPLIAKSVELRRITELSFPAHTPPPEYTSKPNSFIPSCSENGTASEKSFRTFDNPSRSSPQYNLNLQSSKSNPDQPTTSNRIDLQMS